MKLYGKFKGKVVDNIDALKRGRVLVLVPSLNSKKPIGWAEACMPPSYFAVPHNGEQVWVEFENGDIQLPIYTGSVVTRDYLKRIMKGIEGNYDVNVVAVATNNNQLIMRGGDSKGVTQISINDNNGNSVILDGNNAGLKLTGGRTVNGGTKDLDYIPMSAGSSTNVNGKSFALKGLEVERY